MIMTYEMEKKTTRLNVLCCGESKNNVSGRFKRGGGGGVDMVESR